MSFLAPTAFVLAALVGPLVALYMLRSRRRRVVVSSLLMWDEAPRSVSSARPWERLRVTPLFLLQLLVLVLFILSLARPSVSQRSLLGPHTVLVLDTSASMAQAGRFERAINEARSLSAEASEDRLVSIVTAGSDPSVLAAFSSDPAALDDVLDGLVPTGGAERLDEAIRLARGLATPDRPTSTVILSDGGSFPLALEPVAEAFHVAFHDPAPNVGLSLFAPTPDRRGSVMLEIANVGIDEAIADVVIAVDGAPATRLTIEVGAGSVARRQVELDAPSGAVIEAEIRGDDGSDLDDRAAYVVADERGSGIRVVGERSLFIEALLRALPGVEQVADGGAAVIVNGGPVPDGDLPVWLIRTEPPVGVEVTGLGQNLVVGFQRPGEPLLDGVDLSGVVIGETDIVNVVAPEHLQTGVATGWLPLVRAGETPLLMLGEVGGHRAIYQPFLLEHSNLPVQVAFPVLARNIIDWLMGGAGAGGSAEPVGQPLVLPEGATLVDGPLGEVDVAGLGTLDSTHQPGVYRVFDEEGNLLLAAARSLDAAEIWAVPRIIETTPPMGDDSGEGRVSKEWVGWLVGTILVFSLLEWWVGHRSPPGRHEVAS